MTRHVKTSRANTRFVELIVIAAVCSWLATTTLAAEKTNRDVSLIVPRYFSKENTRLWERGVFSGVIVAAKEASRRLGLPDEHISATSDDDTWFCGCVKLPSSELTEHRRFAITISASGRLAAPYYFTLDPKLKDVTIPICFPLVDSGITEHLVNPSVRPKPISNMRGDESPVAFVSRVSDDDSGPDGVRMWREESR